MKQTALIIAFTTLCAGVISAQAQNPISAGQKLLHTMAKNNILRSAQKMPEENYSFKPSPDVRTFGQLIAHVADAQYSFCAPLFGKPDPAPGIEKSKTSKADLIQALKDAFAYCDPGYDGLTEAKAGEMVKFFGTEQARVTVLAYNTAHNNEHYGNIVTYLRMKGLVPPSSERGPK
jgi:uncharacterized damage-inducible protein DinB